MEATDLSFGLVQVVEIVVLAGSAFGVYYGLKRSNEKNADKAKATEEKLEAYKKDMDEKFLHARNSKKANVQMLMDNITANKLEVEKKESKLYDKIEDARAEQKAEHEGLKKTMEGMNVQLHTINNNLAELTGYIRAKKEKP